MVVAAHDVALATTISLLVVFGGATGLCFGSRAKPLLNAPESAEHRERRVGINAAILPKARVVMIVTGILFVAALIVTLTTR